MGRQLQPASSGNRILYKDPIYKTAPGICIMSPDTQLAKRIKRHVIGRIHTYFAATAPGFETLCFKELSALAPSNKTASVVTGGVEFKGRMQDCYQANLHLRTAGRILMRIHQFKASSFRQLEKKAAEIPWELYLAPNLLPEIHATTNHCRLYHTDALCERFLYIISKYPADKTYNRRNKSKVSSDPKIFVRGANDRFTVSIDSSGDHLHKRGLKRHTGKAPLRETIAAAALLLAGYNGIEPLIDPMCGTGTFSLEAALMAKNIPAGWFREFAFIRWPAFSLRQWEYLKRQSEIHFSGPKVPLIFASDKDPSACRRLEKCLTQHNLSDVIKVSKINFFDFLPRELTNQTGWIVINPPYGRRIGSREKSERLFLTICARLKQEYKGWKLVLIAPSTKLKKKIPFQLKTYPFLHGGLKLTLMVGHIR